MTITIVRKMITATAITIATPAITGSNNSTKVTRTGNYVKE